MSSMRSSTKRILAGVAALALGASAASAAPLVNITVLGSTDGVNYSDKVPVSAGSVVQVKVLAQLAPIGTANGSTTISSETAGTDGINTLKCGVAGPISITGAWSNLALGNGWTGATGTTPGTPSGVNIGTISGTAGTGDYFGGFAAGTFKGINGSPETILTGTFTVGTATADSTIAPAAFIGGSLKVNGSVTKFISSSSETGASPFVGVSPLTLQVPEPASLGLLGVSALGLMARRRKA